MVWSFDFEKIEKGAFKKSQQVVSSIQSVTGNLLQSTIHEFLSKEYTDEVELNFDRKSNYVIENAIIENTENADFVIQKDQTLYIIELKNGAQFDVQSVDKMVEQQKFFEIYGQRHNIAYKNWIVCWDSSQFKKVREKLRPYTISGVAFCETFNLNHDMIDLAITWYRDYKIYQHSSEEGNWSNYADFSPFLTEFVKRYEQQDPLIYNHPLKNEC